MKALYEDTYFDHITYSLQKWREAKSEIRALEQDLKSYIQTKLEFWNLSIDIWQKLIITRFIDYQDPHIVQVLKQHKDIPLEVCFKALTQDLIRTYQLQSQLIQVKEVAQQWVNYGLSKSMINDSKSL